VTRSVAVFGLLFSLTVSVPFLAKGDMVIEVKGRDPEHSDQDYQSKDSGIHTLGGPGVNHARVPDAEGFIADWHSDVVPQPPPESKIIRLRLSPGQRFAVLLHQHGLDRALV
jgi:hypothetical protein